MAAGCNCARCLVPFDESGDSAEFCRDEGDFPATDKVGSLHVFDIGGNKLRLIAVVHYNAGKVFIRQVLDHASYNRDAWKN